MNKNYLEDVASLAKNEVQCMLFIVPTYPQTVQACSVIQFRSLTGANGDKQSNCLQQLMVRASTLNISDSRSCKSRHFLLGELLV